jgi:hypothetical protein
MNGNPIIMPSGPDPLMQRQMLKEQAINNLAGLRVRIARGGGGIMVKSNHDSYNNNTTDDIPGIQEQTDLAVAYADALMKSLQSGPLGLPEVKEEPA